MKIEKVQERLDTIVSDNRVTISLIFPLVGALSMIVSAEFTNLPNILRFNPVFILIGVIVMRIPLVGGILPLINKRSGFVISVLVAYTYAIEIIGVKTGRPYGEFEYGVSLGPMIFDLIPLALPLFFIPLVMNSYMLCVLLTDKTDRAIYRIPMVVTTVILVDMILDPAAVSLGLWEYVTETYYGVPIQNFIGWIISGLIATLAIDIAFDTQDLRERLLECDYFLDDMVSFTIMWGIINLYYLSIVPVLLCVLFVVMLIKIDRFNFVGIKS